MDSRIIPTICIFFILINSMLTANLGPSPTARSSSEFATSLYNQISGTSSKENVIFSPASVQQCLALAYFGAKGQTETEMANGLHLHTSDKTVVANRFGDLLKSSKASGQLNIANKIYVSSKYHIKNNFNSVAVESFQSETEEIDFKKGNEAVQTINHWVATKTNNKIKNLVSSIKPKTAMILVNAIHFKAEWSNKFNGRTTSEADFWITPDTAVKVQMMTDRGEYYYGEWSDLDAVAVGMPYKDSDLSMVVVLPNKRDGLQDLEKKLTEVNILNLSNQLKPSYTILDLPKFKIESEFKLNDVLENMGMNTMFTDNADFTDLFEGNAEVKVTEVVHKAFIEVNEEGTEASAATYVKFYPESAIIEQNFVKVDHPFLFFIKNRDSIYFMGHIKKF